MSVGFIILFMLFCHVFDDYYLQGILASMKQKKWWKENAPQRLYRYDYIAALIMHSLSWSFMVMLPIAIRCGFDVSLKYILVFFSNAVIHGIVDDLKANKQKINLITDQIIHVFQIAIIAIIMV